MVAKLTQIYYEDYQLKEIYPFAEPYFNKPLTIFFENEIIKDLVLASTDEKIGVCSWKLRSKMRWNLRRPRPLTQEVIETDYDVLCFTGNTENHKMLGIADRWHPGFRDSMTKILSKLGMPVPFEVKTPIYQNSFMAKREIYQDYVKNWLSPAMDVMTNDLECNALAMQDSKYSQLAKKDAASPEYLMSKIGIPYYPMSPFLLERLFSIYCHNNKIKVTQL